MKTQFKIIFNFFLSLLFGLQVHRGIAQGLHCYSCQRVRVTEHACGYNPNDPWQGAKNCPENQVCFKELVYRTRNKTVENYVRKGCTEDQPPYILNQCVNVPDASPPYPGVICLCNNEDYCNGEAAVKSKPSGWSEFAQLVCFVSAPIIINYVVLMIKLDFLTV